MFLARRKTIPQAPRAGEWRWSGTARLVQACASVGVLSGFGLALKVLDARRALDLTSNSQWFALTSLASSPFLVWTTTGLVLGLVAGLFLAFLGRYEIVRRQPQRVFWLLLRISAVALLLLAIGMSVVAHARTSASGPDILLIVLDTTRPDRMSLYGYERTTTPNLDRLAAESTVFSRAYSTSSWTPPSHASLFTGLYPCVHGVTQQAPAPLPARFFTLAEALWEAGYRTIAAVGNPMLRLGTGFEQGFEAYHETWKLEDENGRHPVERLLKEVLESESDRPFLFFVNMMEPHSPYDSSREFLGLWNRHPELDVAGINVNGEQHNLGIDPFTDAELERLGDLYDAEIRYVDSVLGRLVGLLLERGTLDETLLVITADHGENFGEHGLVGHTLNLYETNVRVPLLVRYPTLFAAGARDSARVQLHDLYETVLSVAGRGGRHATQGRDLLRLDPSEDGLVFAEYAYPAHFLSIVQGELAGRLGSVAAREYLSRPEVASFKRSLRAVRDGRFKLILGSDGSAELYDLQDDSGELQDLASVDEYADQRLKLRAELERKFEKCVDRSATASSTDVLDEKTKQQLKSLGYIQ